MYWNWTRPPSAGRKCPVRAVLWLALACCSGALVSQAPVKQNAQRAWADYAQAQALLHQGRLAEANVVLNHALLLAPDSLPILQLAGRVSAAVGHEADALRLLRRAVALAPRSAETHYDLSIALATEPDLPAALAEASEAVRLAPASGAMHRNRGKVLAGLDRMEDAVGEYTRALGLDPNDAKAMYDLALLEEKRGDTAAEAKLLEQLTQRQPDNAVALDMLGTCRSRAGDQAGATEAWRRVLVLKPDDREALYRLAQSTKRTDPQESTTLMRRFAAAQQSNDALDAVRAEGNQGYHAMQAGEWKLAIGHYASAIALCDRCTLLGDLMKDLGLAECRNDELEAGERDLRAALALKPADPEIVQAIQAAQAQALLPRRGVPAAQ